MKNHELLGIALFWLLLAVDGSLTAQEFKSTNQQETHVNLVQLKAGDSGQHLSLKMDATRPVVVKVIGYNPLFYNIRVNAKDSVVHVGEPPKLISGLTGDFLAWLSKLKVDLISKEKDRSDKQNFDNTLDSIINNIVMHTTDLIKKLKLYAETTARMYHSWHYDQYLDLKEDFDYYLNQEIVLLEDLTLDYYNNIQKSRNFETLERFQEYAPIIDSLKAYIVRMPLHQTLADFKNYKSSKGEYQSLPFFINEDVKEVTVEITPYSKDALAPSYNTVLLLRKKNIPYFGFSSGFFLSDVRQHSYSSMPESSGGNTGYIAVAEDVSRFQTGIQAMVHAGIQLSDWLAAQFGAGPTLGFQDKMIPGLAVGVGLGLGQKNKLTVTTGWHYSFVQRLSRAFSDSNNVLSEAPSSFTVSSPQQGWFLALGYNFLKF
ncbi:MAG: hypothetical protein IPM26_15200 [Saprospiraceae bacterium]|nr:hypothetical protein [Saprospiraceae bacterium]